MLGTGPLRRGGRRAGSDRLGDVARQRLMEARNHFQDGAHAEALPLFERMAGVARERSMPRVATHLSARAAACHAHLGQTDGFNEWLEHAIADARQDSDPDRSARTFGALLEVLRASPLAERASDVESTVRRQLGVVPKVRAADAETNVNRNMRRHLPQKCAACGAPLDVEDVHFNEDGSVDCDTCGAIVTG